MYVPLTSPATIAANLAGGILILLSIPMLAHPLPFAIDSLIGQVIGRKRYNRLSAALAAACQRRQRSTAKGEPAKIQAALGRSTGGSTDSSRVSLSSRSRCGCRLPPTDLFHDGATPARGRASARDRPEVESCSNRQVGVANGARSRRGERTLRWRRRGRRHRRRPHWIHWRSDRGVHSPRRVAPRKFSLGSMVAVTLLFLGLIFACLGPITVLAPHLFEGHGAHDLEVNSKVLSP